MATTRGSPSEGSVGTASSLGAACPFDPREILARVTGRLRRTPPDTLGHGCSRGVPPSLA